MSHETRAYLSRQLETAWLLTDYHLQTLTTEECLWRPAERGLHVHRLPDGQWHADWPEHEGYDLGPSSIAWLTWHLGFWWSMVLDHSFGNAALARENVAWPGSADQVRQWVAALKQQWQASVEPLADDELRSPRLTRWPFSERPFGDVVAWVNIELTKSAAEIGYARFLYAVRTR
jgi:hypothetical protein